MNKAAATFLILILTLVLCSCGTLSEPVQTISAQASDVLENKENIADELEVDMNRQPIVQLAPMMVLQTGGLWKDV